LKIGPLSLLKVQTTMKVLSVFGTRPEGIKLAPVIRKLLKNPGRIDSKVCVTAQHREMLDQVLDLFGLVPDYDLKVMEDNQTPTQVAAAVMARLEPVLQEVRPDWVLIQGDTATVAAAAWAAFYARVKVGHVEAGLRTFDKWQPFPEEINRRIAAILANLHFAPTERARQNLLGEGVPDEHILVTGNPIVDALQWVAQLPYDASKGPLMAIPWERRIILVTAHRRENFGKPLLNICRALRQLVCRYSDQVHIVYPVHLNPNIWGPVHRELGNQPNITLIPPLDYLPLVYLMSRSYLVLTDSGGIQEEAPGLGKPVLVLREVTERPEGVEAGIARVVGMDNERIVTEAAMLLDDEDEYQSMARCIALYGNGHAAEQIVRAMLDWHG
jgi:UDP-N-acetylglucosamine 2-epimerase (non-hydrolysing)